MRSGIRHITSLRREDIDKILTTDDVEAGEGISLSFENGKLKISIARSALGSLLWRYINSGVTSAVNIADMNDAMRAIENNSY